MADFRCFQCFMQFWLSSPLPACEVLQCSECSLPFGVIGKNSQGDGTKQHTKCFVRSMDEGKYLEKTDEP